MSVGDPVALCLGRLETEGHVIGQLAGAPMRWIREIGW